MTSTTSPDPLARLRNHFSSHDVAFHPRPHWRSLLRCVSTILKRETESSSRPLVVVLEAGSGSLGAYLAECLPASSAECVLLADERYFRERDGVSLAHLEGLKTTVPLAAKRVGLKRQGGVPALVDHATSRGRGGRAPAVLLVAESLAGVSALRALRLFARLPAPCSLIVAELGGVPDGFAGHHVKNKAVYMPFDGYAFGAREVARRAGADDGARTEAWREHLKRAAGVIARGGDRWDARSRARFEEAGLSGGESRCSEGAGSAAEFHLDIIATREASLQTPSSPSTQLVILFIKDQLKLLKYRIEAHLVRLGMLSQAAKEAGAESALNETVLADGSRVVLVRSTPDRFKEGGYAACHYVRSPPEAHAACFELLRVPAVGDERPEGEEEPNAGGDRVGYIAVSALEYGGGRGAFPLGEEGAGCAPERHLACGSIDRLVVLPRARGVGAKEALLRVCDAYHLEGYPVRIKTGKPEVHAVLSRCDLLRFDGHRGARSSAKARAIVAYNPDLGLRRKEAFHTMTAAYGKRGDKEGWAHWYSGSSVLHPTSKKHFLFVDADEGFREVK